MPRWWFVLLVGCHVTSTPPSIENVARIPITLDAVRAQQQPGVGVTIVEHPSEKAHREPSGGGGACHSIACAVLWLLPEDKGGDYMTEPYVQATIDDHGTIFEATFAGTPAKLARAMRRDAKSVHYFEEITALDRHLVVEVQSAPVNADGSLGDPVKTALLPQIDLSAAYLEKLVRDQIHHDHAPGSVGAAWAKAEARAELTIAEMNRVLAPFEMHRVATAWQAEPRLNDVVKQLLLR